MASNKQSSLFSWACLQLECVCVLRAKQQETCLLLRLMKCQWFGLSSRDTGCEKHFVFMFGCRRHVQAAGRCCVSSHPSCWDDSPDWLHNSPPIITSPGRHLFENTQKREFTLATFSLQTPDLFLFTSVLKVRVFSHFFSAWSKYSMFHWKTTFV